MRVLCISDTHGELEQINRLANETGAEAVIHAGDFGFYDLESPDRLSNRELGLRVLHSHLPRKEGRRLLKTSREEVIEVIASERLLGQFPEFISEI